MALTSISLLPIKPIANALPSSSLHIPSKPFSLSCHLETQVSCTHDAAKTAEPKKWRKLVSTALAAAVVAFSTSNISAMAELNKFEADTRGEFGIGSAAQFGSADLKKAVHVNENFR
ncbi:UNVERIFIED_CONTAM: Thylakoid lumenal protein TL20.3, chloroplastic [Sesamum calycinum]